MERQTGMSSPHDASAFTKEFSEHRFWAKLKRSAAKAGRGVLEAALKLYFASRDADTPFWAKAVMLSALGYFISPIDAIFDATPLAGYADDLGVLAAALATVAVHVKDEHALRARETLRNWLPTAPESQ
jgi:uncharacterized membrane protein YkvA (DUF1232 family)